MGLLDIFSKDKRDEKARSKNIERALNKFAQSADRFAALEALAGDGSDEAFYGLLRRFGMRYDKTIEDEQEKEWVFETLCDKGPAALPAVRRYLLTADSISWPLRILEKIATPEEHLTALGEVLARHEPGYERDPTKKVQILSHIGSYKHERSPALVLPYLKDMDEGVRFTAVDALLALGDEAAARGPLLDLFVSDDEESLRIRIRIADGFAELGWPVTSHRDGVQRKLPDQFLLERDGLLKRRQ